jgi:hypothetical protein
VSGKIAGHIQGRNRDGVDAVFPEPATDFRGLMGLGMGPQLHAGRPGPINHPRYVSPDPPLIQQQGGFYNVQRLQKPIDHLLCRCLLICITDRLLNKQYFKSLSLTNQSATKDKQKGDKKLYPYIPDRERNEQNFIFVNAGGILYNIQSLEAPKSRS